MRHPSPIRRLRRGAVVCATALLAGCLGARGGAGPDAESPFLSPGPLPGAAPHPLRATPALPATPTGRPGGSVPAPVAGIPAGLTAGRGTGVLPGATMPGIGPVHGLVVPVSLGARAPLRDDAALARDLFGAEPGPSAPTLVEQMREASDGLFRATFEVLPTLVDARAAALPRAPAPRELAALAQAVLRGAAERTDLSRFDNDGPDGVPASRDDDGRLDFVVLVVESDAAFPSVTLHGDLAVATPRGVVGSGPVHVLSLARSEAADAGPAMGLWLDGLGLDPGERFFPASFPREVSSLARARLGWLPVDALTAPGTVALEDGRALLAPLQDVAAGGGFWLVERDGAHLFVSRVARKADGHFLATEVHLVRGGEGQVLPLTRQLGERGPRVVVRWPEDGPPEAERIAVPPRPADPVPLRRATVP